MVSINQYNSTIAEAWGANMNLRISMSIYDVAGYVSKYVTKVDTGVSNTDKNINNFRTSSSFEKLRQVSGKLVVSRFVQTWRPINAPKRTKHSRCFCLRYILMIEPVLGF